MYSARTRRIKSTQNVQKRALSGSRLANDCNQFARDDGQLKSLEKRQRTTGRVVCLFEIAYLNERRTLLHPHVRLPHEADRRAGSR